MPDDVREPDRPALAFAMLTQLPRFGNWAEGVREFETPYGTIGYRQASILWILRYGLLPADELTPSGFAIFFRIQPSVVTRALAKLEQSGFIDRSTDKYDTRVCHIGITDAGEEISRYIERLFMDDLLCAMSDIPDDELAGMHHALALLDQIALSLEERRLSRTRRAHPPPTQS